MAPCSRDPFQYDQQHPICAFGPPRKNGDLYNLVADDAVAAQQARDAVAMRPDSDDFKFKGMGAADMDTPLSRAFCASAMGGSGDTVGSDKANIDSGGTVVTSESTVMTRPLKIVEGAII